jgi:hypothetical protein
MDPGLFVAGKNMPDLLEREQFIIEIDNRAAGITENRIHTFKLQTFKEYSSTVHLHKSLTLNTG